MFAVIDGSIDTDVVDSYYRKISNHFNDMLRQGEDINEWYPTKNIRLPVDDPIVDIVKSVLQSRLNIKLTCSDCEMQTWPIGSDSTLHKHDAPRAPLYAEGEDYNSLLYLNDNFGGGQFYTENGISIKPVKGRLTLFRGDRIRHGLNNVENNHRHTIIFWWKNTEEVL